MADHPNPRKPRRKASHESEPAGDKGAWLGRFLNAGFPEIFDESGERKPSSIRPLPPDPRLPSAPEGTVQVVNLLDFLFPHAPSGFWERFDPPPPRPSGEPPTAAAPGDDSAAVFPADGLLQGFMGEVGGKLQPVVDARELHGFLGSRDDFSTWVKDQIERARLKENKHFGIFRKFPKNSPEGGDVCSGKNRSKKSGRGGHNRIDYHLTLQGAQHLAMIANTDMGFQVRDYFIECEERYRESRARVGAASLPVEPDDGPEGAKTAG